MALTKADMADSLFNELGLNKREARELVDDPAIDLLGADAVVAAGSVLTNDAPPKKVVLGSPARENRDVPEEQLLDNQGWDD